MDLINEKIMEALLIQRKESLGWIAGIWSIGFPSPEVWWEIMMESHLGYMLECARQKCQEDLLAKTIMKELTEIEKSPQDIATSLEESLFQLIKEADHSRIKMQMEDHRQKFRLGQTVKRL